MGSTILMNLFSFASALGSGVSCLVYSIEDAHKEEEHEYCWNDIMHVGVVWHALFPLGRSMQYYCAHIGHMSS